MAEIFFSNISSRTNGVLDGEAVTDSSVQLERDSRYYALLRLLDCTSPASNCYIHLDRAALRELGNACLRCVKGWPECVE